jgi:hypothetical protein
MFMDIKNNRAMTTLIITYLIVAVLLVLGIVFFSRSFSENIFTARQKSSMQAIAIAEGGLEKAFYELKLDIVNDPTNPSWADGDINGMVCGPNIVNFYTLYSSTNLNNGTYTVELKNVAGENFEIWVKSTGTVGDISKTVQTYVRIRNFSIWNNAIFAGAGASGALINGNVDIRGSVHILGNGLQSSDYAIDMGGSGNVGNNYQAIPAELSSRIPACPTTMFNGEVVGSLEAAVRIKNGLVGLSGAATIGDPDFSGNTYKETIDEVFNTDGYGGNQGVANVYSDNGAQNGYDLGDQVTFPSLSDPYQGYSTYLDYLRANALVVSNPAQLNQLASITPTSSFNYTDPNGKGSISMDGNGGLAINGIVYIDGGSLNMNKGTGQNKTINYSGRGSILATEDVEINVNLLTNGASSFPNNILGIMTPQDIEFDSANINVMGMFYAEDEITSAKQTSIAGSFASNYFDMGQQVPSIFQVPDAANNLPPGMISGIPVWIMRVVSWQEL